MSAVVFMALVIGIPTLVVTVLLFVMDWAAAAYAKRREAESAEFVLWVEDYS